MVVGDSNAFTPMLGKVSLAAMDATLQGLPSKGVCGGFKGQSISIFEGTRVVKTKDYWLPSVVSKDSMCMHGAET